MKRAFDFILVFSIIAVFCVNGGGAFASSSVTLSSKNLAKALGKATLWDTEGNTISADVNGKEVSFKIVSGEENISVDVEKVALIEFTSGDNSQAIKNADLAKSDIAKFTGLKSLSLNNCTALTSIDLSGNNTLEILDISNLSRLRKVKASNMSSLKAVGVARVELEDSSSLGDMLGGLGGGGNNESTPAIATLSSNVLENLTDLDLSNNPNLSGVGYVLTQEGSDSGGFGNMFGGGNGGSNDVSAPKVTKYGYKIHSVLTTLKKDTTFLKADKSYSEEPADDGGSNNFLSGFLTGSNGNVLGKYSDETVNLLPALKTFNLKNSGKNSTYINDIDIEALTALTSADFSGMTKLSTVSLPAGNTLKNLDLTGDTALKALDLSYTKGFVYPIGFRTLTGLTDLRIYERYDVMNSIDVSPFPKLVTLNLTGNNLASLDVSRNPELVAIYIGNNVIRELDLSHQTKIRSIDICNNSLIKIDLSRNINMRVHKNDTDSSVRLSSQKRVMTAEVKKEFDFRNVYPQMTPVERASIVWSSVAGNGQKATSVDVDAGTASFTYFPAVITYDYKSGINYENSSDPVCMTVELRWNITDDELQRLRETQPESRDTQSGDVQTHTESEDSNPNISGSGGGCNAGAGFFGMLGMLILASGLALKYRPN